jgi:D-alanyl-D-alanine carboxypeptidase
VSRRAGRLVIAAVILLVSAPGYGAPSASAGPAVVLDGAVADRLDASIDDVMNAAAIPGALVGIWGPDGDYVKAFGVADKATGAPMKTDFYHRIGSVTKTLTVTGILQLADEGRLTLDDPIDRYVDGVPRGNEITLRELARMQSGLFNYTNSEPFWRLLIADPYRSFTPRQALDYAFAEPTVFPPGQGFDYSNTNTILLGLVVERLSGQSLPDYFRDHITAPLGMSHTIFAVDGAYPEPHSQGYTNLTVDDTTADATDWNPSWGWAAGAVISNLEDMHVWAQALASGRMVSPRMQEQRLQTVTAPPNPPSDGYGLGLFELSGWIGHNGSLPGYQTAVFDLPEKQTTMVVFTNTDIGYRGSDTSALLATAITTIITPGNVYRLAPH